MTDAATPEGAPATMPGESDLDVAARRMIGYLDRQDGTATDEQKSPATEAKPVEAKANEPEKAKESKEADPAPTEADAQPSPKHKVKVRGQEVEVSLEEALAGYSRTQDYKAKTAELAEQRKAIEAEANAIQQTRQSHLSQLDQLIPALQQQVAGEFADIKTTADLEKMAADDPARFTRWQAKQVALQQAKAEQARLAGELKSKQEREYREFLQAEHAKLIDADPIFADAEKGKAEKVRIRDYLKAQGFDDEAINGLADHRSVLIARKAMMYDQVKNAKPEEKRVSEPPKVMKPGPAGEKPPVDERAKAARQQLRKSGRLEDAAKAFEHLLG